MIELEHSPLGGSATKRFMNCDGSFLLHREQLEDGIFEQFPSEFADRGTGAHELGAVCLTDGTEPFEYIGREFNGYKAGWPGGIELDAVSVYVDTCRSILARHNAPGSPQDTRQLIEATLRAEKHHRLLKGTVDYACWSQELGIDLVDYKNGEGVGVDVVNNDQLKYYAFLLILNYMADWHGDTPVRLWIVQPNFYGIFEAPIPWETTLDQIVTWGLEILLPQMRKLDIPRDIMPEDFRTGDWCKFCPVLLDCPLMQKAYKTYAEMGDEEFLMMLTDEELSDYYAMLKPAMRFKNELEKVIYARKVGGSTIASAKLVPKKVARQWKPGAEAAAQNRFGSKAMEPAKFKSPAGLEKLSSDGKAFALEWGFSPNDGALTIAPLDDPRTEVSGKNARVFEKFASVDKPVDIGEF